MFNSETHVMLNGMIRPILYGFNRIIFFFYNTFTIYHQGFFHSVRRNPSLNCLHRRRSLAILGHEGPRWWIRLSLHLVLGLPCRLFHSRGVHSVTLFVHLSYNKYYTTIYPLSRECLFSYSYIVKPTIELF